MATIAETTTDNKPHRSRERIYEDALKTLRQSIRDWPYHVVSRALLLDGVTGIIDKALREANTCELCGWVGSDVDPVIEVTERVYTDKYRNSRQCKFILACVDRQRTEVRA